jgi:putative ABC transport system ATP-binding protein
MITLQEVRKQYNGLDVLKGINLHIEHGEFASIVGQSGCGKSTLLNMITGIDRPTSGSIHVAGTHLNPLRENGIAQWRRRSVGIVFQFFQLLPTLTIAENIMLPMHYAGTYPRQRQQRALMLLDQVGLPDSVAHRFPSQLSGGQQQRVAIARALANDPDLLVGDEPTGNLDEQSAAHIFGLFKMLVDGGKTVVMVTHDPALAECTSRRIEMHNGLLVEDRVLSRP